jgi:hypothetical protein
MRSRARPDGTTCRDVTQSVDKGGQTQSQDVTLCKTQVAQSDGSHWVIQIGGGHHPRAQ